MKKALLTIVLVAVFAMGYSQSFFNTYIVEQPPTKTPQEWVDGMTGLQKAAMLNGFSNGVKATQLDRAEIGIPKDVAVQFYRLMNNMKNYGTKLMRGEVVITPEVVDPETGEVITPAVMNTPPTTQNQLRSQIHDEYGGWFSLNEIGVFVNRMVQYSRLNIDKEYDGTWEVFVSGVTQ